VIEEPATVVPKEPVAQHEIEYTPPLPANGTAAPAAPATTAARAPPKSEPIIPLVHAPDDPGPVAEVDEDAEAEQEAAKAGGWRKIFE
jgi:hypothetical protein